MSAKNRAIFLDRDGTINIDSGYVHSVEEFRYFPNTKEALRLLQSMGYILLVITNQSGIARKLYGEDDYEELTNWMLDDLRKEGVRVSKVYHCPHHPEFTGVCDCRKPSTGLFMEAAQDFDLNLDACWSIGDSVRDLEICKETGCKGILLTNKDVEDDWYATATNLLEAVDIIAKGE